MKRRHHYVPKFYLRAFASSLKRINVFNLPRGKAIRDASLRDQCYHHRLYGPSNELEDWFAHLEGRAAPVIESIRTNYRCPEVGSDGYAALLSFMALQLVRTKAARDRIQQRSTRAARAVFDEQPIPAGFIPDAQESMALSLGTLLNMAAALDGMKAHVVKAPSEGLITSDNPAFKYNQYCEGIRWSGVLGATCRGFQVFLPISPTALVLLFDGGVYKVGQRGIAASSMATQRDVELLNLFQAVSAQENLYFSNWETKGKLETTASLAAEERSKNRHRVIKAYEVANDRSELLAQFEQMPDFKTHLSFVSLRREARRVPLAGRVRLYRKRMPLPYQPSVPPLDDGRTRIFETRYPV